MKQQLSEACQVLGVQPLPGAHHAGDGAGAGGGHASADVHAQRGG